MTDPRQTVSRSFTTGLLSARGMRRVLKSFEATYTERWKSLFRREFVVTCSEPVMSVLCSALLREDVRVLEYGRPSVVVKAKGLDVRQPTGR